MTSGSRKKNPTNGLHELRIDHTDPSTDSQLPSRSNIPSRIVSAIDTKNHRPPVSSWLRWAVQPRAAFKLLILPVVFSIMWEFFAPLLTNFLATLPGSRKLLSNIKRRPNPFAALFLLSHRVNFRPSNDPRYEKGLCDLLFIAYNVVFFSFVRQTIAVNISHPLARYYGLKRPAKINRFGEQVYAIIYWGIMGAWGSRIMSQLPTYWYQTEHFWIGYPHWDMKPELKRYYLMQISFWSQQLFVLVLKLEKPRKDYYVLVVHHWVTIWLVGWSYFFNLTVIGNAVYVSMDVPDTFLATSLLLNYMRWEKLKVVAFATLIAGWTYFRHFLNLRILWSVWYEYDLIPDAAKRWDFAQGVYLNWWMKYQIFTPLLLLQFLNLYWYFLIWRIAYRALFRSVLDDERSDNEDDSSEREARVDETTEVDS